MPNLRDMFAIKLVEYLSNMDAKSEKMIDDILRQHASRNNIRTIARNTMAKTVMGEAHVLP